MSAIPLDSSSCPAIERRHRLQWEAAQGIHVLLYPEGMVKLNTSASEILKRCDGATSVADITVDLEKTFAATGLGGEVMTFLAMAVEKNWVVLRA